MEEFLRIIKEYNLEKYLKILLEDNSGNNNQYHNFFHSQCVFVNSYKIAKYENKFDDNDIRNLLIASLFHDFNHSAGLLKDHQNVHLAVVALSFYFKDEESVKNFKIIKDLIYKTEFPFNEEIDNELTDLEKVLRDADIMQTVESNFIQQILFGLYNELKIENDLIKRINYQIEFMKTIRLFTEYGNLIIKAKIIKLIDDLKYIKEEILLDTNDC